ncbi:beta-galactosidase, partial [candidate division KSB1 bacterium]|nr:beta-galactosidase [candidate division KSB1 bacterium]
MNRIRMGQQIAIMVAISLLLISKVVNAQKFNDINKYIENPRMYAENQEATHVPLMPFDTEEQALAGDWLVSPWFISLNGQWKFKWVHNPYEVPEGFWIEGYDVSAWDDIAVPGVWQMQGYGYTIYRNIPQAFYPFNPPYVPDDINP